MSLRGVRSDTGQCGERGTYLGIADDVEEGNNIRSSGEILENLDFPLDLLLLDWFEDFDDAFLFVDHINSFEYL